MIVIILLMLGLCFGSFTNALVWRLHEKEQTKRKRPKKGQDPLSIVYGRSMCPHCRHELAAKDLVPVLSWISLGGKCRYCRKPIEDSPLVEILLPLSFVISYAFWPYSWTNQTVALFIVWLIVLVIFAALTLYDLKWMLLPNRLVFIVIGLAAVQVLLKILIVGSLDPIVSAILGMASLGGLFYVLFQVSGGQWIGGGDVKLGIGLGLLVGGPLLAFLVLFLAALGGSLVSLPLLFSKRFSAASRIPFGPFLLLASVLVYLFGSSWIEWLEQALTLS